MKKKQTPLTKRKRKNEFRYHDVKVLTKKGKKKIKHPSYIFEEQGNIYRYHSITHSSSIDGITLKKLRINPNPKDKRDAYYDTKRREQ